MLSQCYNERKFQLISTYNFLLVCVSIGGEGYKADGTPRDLGESDSEGGSLLGATEEDGTLINAISERDAPLR